MKINFLLPHLKISGGVRITLMYAHFLSKIGHEVNIIVQNKNTIRRMIANFFHIKPIWFLDLRANIVRIASWHSDKILNSDIIVADSWEIAKYVYTYKTNAIKFHFIQHDERLYHGDRDRVSEIYNLKMNKIVVSSWLHNIFIRDFERDINLLLNPIDRDFFRSIDIERQDDDIRILLLHHTYEWKGTKEGVRIVQELKEKYPQIKLILFGAREKNIHFSYDEYYYNLPQEKLPWLYSNTDIYLCPSWDEGSGLPSMEAMACKCALVTYNNGGSRDYAFDGETAMVAKRRDVNDLKNKLEQVVTNKKLRKKVSKNGYNFIQKMPTWEEQTNKLENIFKKVIRK